MMKRIAVIGSRSFKDRKEEVKEIFNSQLHMARNVVGISGGAEGVDNIFKQWCNNMKVPHIEFLPYHKLDKSIKFSPKFFFIRNIQIINNSDEVIAIWDGKSTGTKMGIEYAKRKGKIVHIFNLQN